MGEIFFLDAVATVDVEGTKHRSQLQNTALLIKTEIG